MANAILFQCPNGCRNWCLAQAVPVDFIYSLLENENTLKMGINLVRGEFNIVNCQMTKQMVFIKPGR